MPAGVSDTSFECVVIFRGLQEIRQGYFVHENLENGKVNSMVG